MVFYYSNVPIKLTHSTTPSPNLGDLNDMSCKKMSAFRSWCEQQGIDIEYAETIRMKWYRMRKAYQEKGINLFNLKRCKKDDFS